MSSSAMNAGMPSDIRGAAGGSDQTRLWIVFIGAVAIRWLYGIILFVGLGAEGLMGNDSRGYLGNAQEFVNQATSGTLHGWAWLGGDLGVMPLYPWLVSLNILLFGNMAPLTIVLVQGLIDAGTCILIFRLAGALDLRFALPAAVAAAINPTQIVLAGLIYTDTLFLFCATIFLLGAVTWLKRPGWSAALAMGAGAGLAAFDRVVIAPFFPVAAVALLVAQIATGRFRAVHLAQIAAAAAMLGLAIAPTLIRNGTVYGAWTLTPQGGAHLALWVVPLVKEAKDGTPWERGAAEMAQRKADRFGKQTDNPFVESRQYAEIGREALSQLGTTAVIKAWAVGASINLAAPGLVISPPLARLPRTGFFATHGDSTAGKIFNFLFRSDSARYAQILLAGIAGLGIVRLIQLGGVYVLWRDRRRYDRTGWATVILLALWCGFIIAANGPIASPKYRLPIEPVLCVLTGAGICLLRRTPQAQMP